MGNAAVELIGMTKSYGPVEVLRPLDLRIEVGSFTSLLGPSGCGKTTVLNLIAGLDQPSAGVVKIQEHVVFDGTRRVDVPTEKRNIGFVFQTYALWPHMTVLQNVAYPLRIRKVDRSTRNRTAREILEWLELGQLQDRYPFQLSGGQQQRVAIARSLVYRAKLMLLDEPLSNLDAQLRERARSWLADVHREFDLTTILVTHDQGEAMSLSDRVILLNGGQVVQDGRADEIYNAPTSSYAAEFVGNANLIPGTVIKCESAGRLFSVEVEVAPGLCIRGVSGERSGIGTSVSIAVRPHRLELWPAGTSVPEQTSGLPFRVHNALYQGASYEILGDTPVGRLRAQVEQRPASQTLLALLHPSDCWCIPDHSSADRAARSIVNENNQG